MHVGFTKILLTRSMKSLRIILPLLITLFLLIPTNQILALTITKDFTVNTAIAKSPQVTLNQGNQGSSSVSTSHDYAKVNTTAGFTFYENASNIDFTQAFYPSSMGVINNSTALSGGLSNMAVVDGVYVSFGEGGTASTPGFTFFFNFTGASSLSTGFDYDVCEYYQGSIGHIVLIELYNFTSGSWISYETFNGESGVVWHHIKVTAANGLIQNGVIMGCMNHTSTGISSHVEYVDFIALTPNAVSSVFSPSSMSVINNSTALSGGLSNLAVVDASYVSFGEGGSSVTPGFTFFFNFTGASSLSSGFDYDICEYYQGSSQHVVVIELYNFTSGSWVNFETFVGESGVVWHHIKVAATSGLIQSGVVMGCLNHTSQGQASHNEYVDFIALTPNAISSVSNPSSMSVVNNSTALSGGLGNIAAVDGVYVSFGEGSSVTPGFTFFFNFTGVSSMNSFDYDICEYYQGSVSHIVIIELYNFTSGSWIKYETFIGESGIVWHHIKVTATNGLIQSGVVMGSMNHTSTGQSSHNEFIDFVSLTPTTQSSPITSASTDFSVPASSGSFTLAAGSSILLFSPTFTSANTIFAGSWTLGLWASASSSGALNVSFVSVDSSNSIVGIAATGTTGAIGTSKSEVKTALSGSQIYVPSGGRLIANITNPTGSGITFTVYWGAGQPTSFQTPKEYDYVVAVTNSASSPLSVSLSTYSYSGISRLTNLTVTIYSPSTNQIIIIDGAFTQSTGSSVMLPASSTLYIQVHATANSFGSSNVMLYMKYSPSARPFAFDVINLTVY